MFPTKLTFTFICPYAYYASRQSQPFCGFIQSLQTNTYRQLSEVKNEWRQTSTPPYAFVVYTRQVYPYFLLKPMFGQCIYIGLNHFPNCYWFIFIVMYFGAVGTGGVPVALLSALTLTPLLRLEIS
jgi:hypothetical protein